MENNVSIAKNWIILNLLVVSSVEFEEYRPRRFVIDPLGNYASAFHNYFHPITIVFDSNTSTFHDQAASSLLHTTGLLGERCRARA